MITFDRVNVGVVAGAVLSFFVVLFLCGVQWSENRTERFIACMASDDVTPLECDEASL